MLEEGEFFSWPDTLADWNLDDVDYWWESEEFGIRAVGVNTDNLIVEDLKQVDGIPAYQATQSWTRGVPLSSLGPLWVLSGANRRVLDRSAGAFRVDLKEAVSPHRKMS